MKSWAKLGARPEKRKKGSAPKDEPGAKRATTASGGTSAKPPLKFTFVLVEKPKIADQGEYRMPDASK